MKNQVREIFTIEEIARLQRLIEDDLKRDEESLKRLSDSNSNEYKFTIERIKDSILLSKKILRKII